MGERQHEESGGIVVVVARRRARLLVHDNHYAAFSDTHACHYCTRLPACLLVCQPAYMLRSDQLLREILDTSSHFGRVWHLPTGTYEAARRRA